MARKTNQEKMAELELKMQKLREKEAQKENPTVKRIEVMRKALRKTDDAIRNDLQGYFNKTSGQQVRKPLAERIEDMVIKLEKARATLENGHRDRAEIKDKTEFLDSLEARAVAGEDIVLHDELPEGFLRAFEINPELVEAATNETE
jgi:hypothetical protein